jgi:pyruvate formate lyase activating enzyme
LNIRKNSIGEQSLTGTIFDIKRFSIHDGPGIRTTVFFKGCPLSCRWCHNPESQARKPEWMFWEDRCLRCQACIAVCKPGAIHLDGDHVVTDLEACTLCGDCVDVCYAEARQISGRALTVAQLMSEIERDIPFYDQSAGGVTFSGGEPLLQAGFLLGLLQACGERGIHTALDTSGFSSWRALDRIRPHVDLFLYDLKLFDPARHKKFTGASNVRILENLQRLSEHGNNIVLRVPIIPDVNDDLENIRSIGSFAASLPHLMRVDILPYHRAALGKYERLHKAYSFSELLVPSEQKMAQTARIFQELGLQVKIGG